MANSGGGTGADDNGDTGSDGFTRLNRYFDALADERRRYALYYLSDRGSASATELARAVVAGESGRPAGALADPDAPGVERARMDLYHKHLPRLVDYGLVEFDARSGQVRYREPPRTFAALLRLSRLLERRA